MNLGSLVPQPDDDYDDENEHEDENEVNDEVHSEAREHISDDESDEDKPLPQNDAPRQGNGNLKFSLRYKDVEDSIRTSDGSGNFSAELHNHFRLGSGNVWMEWYPNADLHQTILIRHGQIV